MPVTIAANNSTGWPAKGTDGLTLEDTLSQGTRARLGKQAFARRGRVDTATPSVTAPTPTPGATARTASKSEEVSRGGDTLEGGLGVADRGGEVGRGGGGRGIARTRNESIRELVEITRCQKKGETTGTPREGGASSEV